MHICYIEATYRLWGIGSLKEKRRWAKHIISALRSRYNVAVAEADNINSKDFLTVGIVTLSRDKAFLSAVVSEVISFLETQGFGHLTDIRTEYL